MKKLIFYLFWLFIIGLMFTHSSCDNEPKEPTYYLDQEIKDYCYFQEGSWWLYQTEDSLSFDSVFCNKSTFQITDLTRFMGIFEESFFSEMESSFYSNVMKLSTEACFDANESIYSNLFMRKGDKVNISPNAYFNPDSAQEKVCGQSGIDIVHLGDFEVYLGFENVRAFKITNVGDSFLPVQIYWAKHIGMIKKVMPDGTVWLLTDFKVNQ